MRGFWAIAPILLIGCSPVATPEVKQYNLDRLSTKRIAKHATIKTLFVAAPKAASGYEREDMIYVKQPYMLNAFAKNEWVAPPAEMLTPVLVQSLQNSGYFRAVVAAPYSGKTNYRLNTTLIELNQNFMKQPSETHITVKVDLVNVDKNIIIATKRFHEKQRTVSNTPYGGVLAANQACQRLMTRLSTFVVNVVKNR